MERGELQQRIGLNPSQAIRILESAEERFSHGVILKGSKRELTYSPATVIWVILIVGEQMRPRISRSFPTISIL